MSLEDFKILKVLGRGASAKVLLVRRKGEHAADNGELYAMKVTAL
jgi:hypothetical protein